MKIELEIPHEKAKLREKEGEREQVAADALLVECSSEQLNQLELIQIICKMNKEEKEKKKGNKSFYDLLLYSRSE